MPYEYEVHQHSINTMGQNLKEWLDKMGQNNWRLVSYHPDIGAPIIFEREIEVNQKLRKIQLEGGLWKKEKSESSA